MLPLLALLAFQTPALEVTATVDRDRVAVGETVLLTIKAIGHSTAAFRVDVQPIDGFALVEQRERTDVGIAKEITRDYTLELELRAELVGTWELGPIKVEQGEASASTPVLSVSVVNASAGASPGLESDMLALIPRVPAPRPFNPSVFVVTSSDQVFAGEQVNVLTAAWLPRGLRLRLRQPPSLTPPALPGVFSTPRAAVPGAVASRVVDGETYDLFVGFQTVYPLNPGPLSIPSARLSWVQPGSRIGSDDRRQSVESTPTTLMVKDLPTAGRSTGFDGPVARDMTVDYRLGQSSARAGAVLQVDVVVSGAGNLPLWPAPKVPWPADARVYQEGTEGAVRMVGQRLGGGKRFRYSVVPDSASSLSLPALEYPYFDPGSGTYKVARTLGILVPVLEPLPVGERGSPVPIEFPGPIPIANRLTGLATPALAGLVVAPLLVAALVGWRRRRPRRRRAPPATGDPAERLETLVSSLARTAGGSAPRTLVAALREAGVEREEAERLIALHASLEAERFGVAGTGRPTPELLRAIEQLLSRIPPQLRRLAGVGAMLFLVQATASLRPARAEAQDGVKLYLRGEYPGAAHAFRESIGGRVPDGLWYDLAASEYMARHDPQAVAALLVARARAPRNRHIESLWNALAREHEQLRSAGPRWPVSAEECLAAALLFLWLGAGLVVLAGRKRPLWIGAFLLSGASAIAGVALRIERAEPRAVLVGGSSLRVSPHGLAPERGTVLPFSVVRLDRRQGGWWLIETSDGAIGWVPADILAPVPALD